MYALDIKCNKKNVLEKYLSGRTRISTVLYLLHCSSLHYQFSKILILLNKTIIVALFKAKIRQINVNFPINKNKTRATSNSAQCTLMSVALELAGIDDIKSKNKMGFPYSSSTLDILSPLSCYSGEFYYTVVKVSVKW